MEVKEPFIAERTAAGPARRPRRAPGVSPPHRGSNASPAGHSSARTPLPRASAAGATHDARQLRRSPLTPGGHSLVELVGRCCSRLFPASGGWGQREGGRHSRWLFAAQVAFCSDGRARCWAASQPAFARAALLLDCRRESAKLFPPLPSALMPKGERWRGRGRRCPGAGKDGGSPALPPVLAKPVRLRDRRSPRLRELPLAPSLRGCSRCPDIMRP